MGGHRGGEVASRTAIEAVRAAIASGRPVNDAITRANTAVLERAAGDADLTGMGTTMTALVVAGRAAGARSATSATHAPTCCTRVSLRRITDDHSLVEELVREGRLTPEQAESHPQRNLVTRALGVDAEVEVDLYTHRGHRRRSRRALLRRSHHHGPRTRHRALLRSEPDPQRAAELLVDAANRAGGEDNTSVVVVDVLEVDPARRCRIPTCSRSRDPSALPRTPTADEAGARTGRGARTRAGGVVGQPDPRHVVVVRAR